MALFMAILRSAAIFTLILGLWPAVLRVYLELSNLGVSFSRYFFMDWPLYYLKKGDMNTKQGAQRLIIVPNAHTERFSLVSRTMCSVIESVSMDLCRCRNSRHTAVLSRFPNAVFLGSQTLTHEQKG